MMQFFIKEEAQTVPIFLVSKTMIENGIDGLSLEHSQWLTANGFNAQLGSICCLPAPSGQISAVYCGFSEEAEWDHWLKVVASLPAGAYRLFRPQGMDDSFWFQLHLHWALAQYSFNRYRCTDSQKCKTVFVGPDIEIDQLVARVTALSRARDLINTPCEDLHPQALAAVCQELGQRFKAAVSVIQGPALLEQGFPTVHLVGRAGAREPCLIELTWGEASLPEVVLLGKGVCFDTGGLDIKTPAGMRTMKKDMGGAACALATAEMIMSHNLPLRLRLLIPAVENNVAANAMRPGDVVTTRSGLTVEISNTDAEGRLVLCDALTYAAESSPKLMIDFATLTGAARVALGPDVPVLFCNNQEMTSQLTACADQCQQPIWSLPLFAAYQRYLKSDVADFMNCSLSGFAGAITAALYLQRFVDEAIPWAHIDIFAWNAVAKPGRPRGGEPHAVQAVFEYLSMKVKEWS